MVFAGAGEIAHLLAEVATIEFGTAAPGELM